MESPLSPSRRVYVEGHGCSASMADTEILRGIIEEGGHSLVEDQTQADISVLVTCSVKSVTEQRMLSRIRDLTQNGSRKLIVAGCLPKADPSKLSQLDPKLSMLGPGNLDKILPTIETTLSGGRMVTLESNKLIKVGLPRSRLNRSIGITEISSGCLSGCTFCQVKLVKGAVFSYPADEIILEVTQLVSSGAKEIWLTSTDNAAYGRDTGTSFPSLLRKVASIPGDFKIRAGMMNPLLTGRLLDDLIDCFRDEKVFKFVHLPLQSGSDRILKAMQRGYSVEDFCRIVSALRRAVPTITLSTDMIVGFPSETENEFGESIQVLEKTRPDIVNISRFGARAGTKAAGMIGQVDSHTSKERSTRMTKRVKEIQFEINSRWVGWSGEVLIDEVVNEALVGRNYAYKPCLFKDDPRLSTTDQELMGRKVAAKVTHATSSTLRAMVL